jgi:hypothetical protein
MTAFGIRSRMPSSVTPHRTVSTSRGFPRRSIKPPCPIISLIDPCNIFLDTLVESSFQLCAMLGVEVPSCRNITYFLKEDIQIFKAIIFRQLTEYREQAAPAYRAAKGFAPPHCLVVDSFDHTKYCGGRR